MSHPRVAVVAPYGTDPVNGVLVAAVAAATAVARQGLTVELWLPHPWPADGFTALNERLDSAGVLRVVLDDKRPPRPWLRPQALRRARQRDVDLLHLHSVFSPHVGQLALSVRRPYVFTPHGGYSPAALRRRRMRKDLAAVTVERPILRRAGAVVALTDAEAEHLRQWCPGTRVVVVPNGVDPAPPVDRRALRRELEVGPHTQLAVFAGRLDRVHKGLDVLVSGLADAPGWMLALVGPDHRGDRSWLEEHARRLDVGRRCRFLGLRQGEELHAALAGGDVFALCSRWEGLPLALLEALSHGTPAVVSSPVERAVPVAARGAGWLSPSGQVGTTLRRVASQGEKERLRRGAAARRLASHYAWDAVGGRLADLYERVASLLAAR